MIFNTEFNVASDGEEKYGEPYDHTFVFGAPFIQFFSTEINFDLVQPKAILYSTVNANSAITNATIKDISNQFFVKFRDVMSYFYFFIAICSILLCFVMTLKDAMHNRNEKRALEEELAE